MLFTAKAIFVEQKWYYLTHNLGYKGVHTFPKGISPKVNVIAQVESELVHFEAAVHHFHHNATITPPQVQNLSSLVSYPGHFFLFLEEESYRSAVNAVDVF